jgi:hypothetical protein
MFLAQKGLPDPTDYPEELDDLMDRTFAFRVKWQHSWGQASVSLCKDNPDLVAKIKEFWPNVEVCL